jgi:hypothetical protein
LSAPKTASAAGIVSELKPPDEPRANGVCGAVWDVKAIPNTPSTKTGNGAKPAREPVDLRAEVMLVAPGNVGVPGLAVDPGSVGVPDVNEAIAGTAGAVAGPGFAIPGRSTPPLVTKPPGLSAAGPGVL